jgi:hypothetical protein
MILTPGGSPSGVAAGTGEGGDCAHNEQQPERISRGREKRVFMESGGQ